MDLIAGVASWWKGSHYLPGNNGAGHSGLGNDFDFLHEMNGVESFGPHSPVSEETDTTAVTTTISTQLGPACDGDKEVLVGRPMGPLHLPESKLNVKERDLPPDWRQRRPPFSAMDDFLGNLDVLDIVVSQSESHEDNQEETEEPKPSCHHVTSVILLDTQNPFLRERVGDIYLTKYHLIHRPCVIDSCESPKAVLTDTPGQWIRIPLTAIDSVTWSFKPIDIVCHSKDDESMDGLFGFTLPVLEVHLKDFRFFRFGLGLGEAQKNIDCTSGYTVESAIVDGVSTHVFKLPMENLAGLRERAKSFETLCTVLMETWQDGLTIPFAFRLKQAIEKEKEKLVEHVLISNTNNAIWDAASEFDRLGVSQMVAEECKEEELPDHPVDKSADLPAVVSWRLSEFNSSYQYCQTYPSLVPVPANVSDQILTKCSKFRAKGRVPALSWKHKNGACLLRSSQPLPGVLGHRSVEDEQVVAASLRASGRFSPASGSHFIVDARPQFNAMANAMVSGGYENTALYPDCRLLFVDVANIHSVRDSYTKLKAACMRPSDDPHWLRSLDSSNWLHNILSILRGALMIARIMDIGQRSVLVHCTDGWDRTAQLVSLAELIMDPYYRTLDGFRSLIEKDFVWFGHRFADRTGIGIHSSSTNDLISSAASNSRDKGDTTRPSEQAPIFIQWLDCVRQIMSQNPSSFEFQPSLLVAIIDLLYSGSFGSFLCNNDMERKVESIEYQTISVWQYINAKRDMFLNRSYSKSENSLVVVATARKLVMWKELFLRWDVNFWEREEKL